MKTLLILFILLSANCFAQNVSDSVIDDLWRASADSVIKTCNTYLHQTPDPKNKIKALYLEGAGYLSKKLYDSAMQCFKTDLTCPNRQYENNYQNESARAIATWFITMKEYDSAICYLDKAEKKFTFFDWGPLENLIYYYRDMSMYYAECYKGKCQYQRAINELEPHMLNSIFTSSNTDWMMDSLYSIYLLVHSKEAIKTEYINAVNSIKIKIEKNKQDTSTSVSATVKIFGKRVLFDQNIGWFNHIFNNKSDTINTAQLKQESIRHFKQMHIYQLATQ